MNVPFAFTFTANAQIGLLWNPNVVTGTPIKNNTILATYATDQLAALSLPITNLLNPLWITSFNISGDTGSTICQLGFYNVPNTTFYPLYQVPVAAGFQNYRPFTPEETGLYVPSSANVIPAIYLLTGTSLICSGDVGVMLLPRNAVSPGTFPTS